MKAAAFSYLRAESLQQALAELAEHGSDARLLAGGQSLVPMMSMRLVRPSRIVDIYRLGELQQIEIRNQTIVVGSTVLQSTLERDARIAEGLPLLAKALRWVGHTQTRNRGTMGGSLVHADPSAELPLCAAMLNARLVLRSDRQPDRVVEARDFFLGPMFTAVGETEALTAIEWPIWTGGRIGTAFDEVAIRHGDFAMASAAAQVQLSPEGLCLRAVVGAGGVDGVPVAFPALAERLVGKLPTTELLLSVAADASKSCEPGSDLHASAEYRRHLVKILVQRVLHAAFDNAQQGSA